MEKYHTFFFVLKFILVIFLLLIYLDKLPKDSNLFLVFDSIFKFSLGIFILYFTLRKKSYNIGREDKILLVITSILLILSIDLINLLKIPNNIIYKKNNYILNNNILNS
jgi:hypothetical protein